MALRGNLLRKTELRRHPRHAVAGMMRIMWESNGQEVMANAKVVDVSIWGVRLRVDTKIPLRSFVTCNDRTLGICGRGSVRYCNLVKGQYEIGVEFTSGSGWRAP
jgi:PilZ domain